MKKQLLFSLFLFAFNFSLLAQKANEIKFKKEKEILYFHEASGGLRIHTNAIGGFIEKGWIKNIHNKKILQLEFSYFFSPNQKRQQGNSPNKNVLNGYVYGKQNDFFSFQLNYGYRKTIAEKAQQSGGVALYFVYMVGISIGFEKPYYLTLKDPDDASKTVIEKYSASNADRFLDNSPTNPQIAGYAGIRYGFKDMKVLPGGHLKIGLHFDWASQDKFIRGLELGLSSNVYYRNVNMMIRNDNKPFLLNAYLSFQLGKRWS